VLSYVLKVRAHLRLQIDAQFYRNMGGREPSSSSYFGSASVSVDSAPSVLSPTLLFTAHCPLITAHYRLTPFRMNTCKNVPKPASLTPFRMNTCKSVSKQRTLTTFRMNTYEKHRGGGSVMVNQTPHEGCQSRLPRASRGATIGRRSTLSRPGREDFGPAGRDLYSLATTNHRRAPASSPAPAAGEVTDCKLCLSALPGAGSPGPLSQ
jgi:hypothetical protein